MNSRLGFHFQEFRDQIRVFFPPREMQLGRGNIKHKKQLFLNIANIVGNLLHIVGNRTRFCDSGCGVLTFSFFSQKVHELFGLFTIVLELVALGWLVKQILIQQVSVKDSFQIEVPFSGIQITGPFFQVLGCIFKNKESMTFFTKRDAIHKRNKSIKYFSCLI